MSDEKILERWMGQYGKGIEAVCYGQLKDHQLAEDAAQETFWKALCSYKKFRGDASEKTWLTRIAINCCKNIRRKRRAEVLPAEARIAEDQNELDAVLDREVVTQAVMQLNEPERRAIRQVYYQGRSVRQLSAESGVSEAALYQRLSRARKKLKLLLVTALLLLCGLVGAALGTVQKNRVNRQELPELDPMQVVSASRAEKRNGQPETREYACYAEAQEALGVRLLALPEESASPGAVYVRTDGTNYALLRVKDFCAVENQAISLNVDVVLSAEQLANLWSTDYLGAYRFVGQTVSEQGYKVDILEETHSERPCRIAVFVADGVRYELRGRVPQNVLTSLISQLK